MRNIAELAIYHILYDLAEGSVHITPDGKKLYFIYNRKLMRVEALGITDFRTMNEDQLTDIVRKHLLTV